MLLLLLMHTPDQKRIKTAYGKGACDEQLRLNSLPSGVLDPSSPAAASRDLAKLRSSCTSVAMVLRANLSFV